MQLLLSALLYLNNGSCALMCSLAGLSISGRERMSLREDGSRAGDSMALEDRGQTPGVTWQASSNTRPRCRSRTSSVWLVPTPCKNSEQAGARLLSETNLPPAGQDEWSAPTGVEPNGAGTVAADHTEALWRAGETCDGPTFFPQTFKPTTCTFKCCLARQITETIKAFLLPFTVPASSTVPCRFVFPLPL